MKTQTKIRPKTTYQHKKRRYLHSNTLKKPEQMCKISNGFWCKEENLKFVAFMTTHLNIFSSVKHRQATKVFTYLSKYLQTRTAQQCRSHFQKIMLKYSTITKFRNKCKKQCGIQAFTQIMAFCPNFNNIFLPKLIKKQFLHDHKQDKDDEIIAQTVKFKDYGVQVNIQIIENSIEIAQQKLYNVSQQQHQQQQQLMYWAIPYPFYLCQ